MPRLNQKTMEKHRENILDACAELYKRHGFQEITMQDIAEQTRLSRPSLYNYFPAKEDIFLALMGREYDCWSEELETVTESQPDRLASALARSLEKRPLMLKLLSVNVYDIEEAAHPDNLARFKKKYAASVHAFKKCLIRSLNCSPGRAEQILLGFFPYMNGLYPWTSPTAKQQQAMENHPLGLPILSLFDLVRQHTKQLFAGTASCDS